MAACRGGVSFWVGCIRGHGGRRLVPRHSWSVRQAVPRGNVRSLRSATWALAPPNDLRYRSFQKPYVCPAVHRACQGADDDSEEDVSMYVLLDPRESGDQPTLVEVPLSGRVELGELLAGGATEPADFPFPLTTVDGRREDDISVIAASTPEASDPERSSFRSLFEAEGCPAPFTLGSCFFCFHCPGTDAGDKLTTGRHLLASCTSLYSYTETQRGSAEEDTENEEKLALMYEQLRMELPRFFVKNHDYSMYSTDVEFINGLLNTRTRGRVAYQLSLTLWRVLCLCYYADARLEVLKLTKHPEDRSIKARWRVKGLPFHTLFLRFYKKDKSQFYRTFDALSTFYLGSNGLIQCHKVEKVMRAQPPVLPKVTSLLAGALVALGLQEDRPAFNLLPLFLSSFRQTRG